MKKIFFYIAAAVIMVPLLSSCATYVRPAPPPLQAEVIGPAPYPDAVWIRGFWVWRQGGYVWIPGHWRTSPPPMQVEVVGVAPYPNAVWVRGHWAWRYGNYVWVRGHWRGAY